MKKSIYLYAIALAIAGLVFSGAATAMTNVVNQGNKAKTPIVDPNRSFVTLTNENMGGLTTCPAGDGPAYQYTKVTCKEAVGDPLPGIDASSFWFTINATGGDTHWYGNLSCTFTAVDNQTDGNGEIRFSVRGDTSIYGNITIRVIVQGIPLNDLDTLPCKSVDFDTNGAVSLADFVILGHDYGKNTYQSDLTWDGRVTLSDLVLFGQHYGHHHL